MEPSLRQRIRLRHAQLPATDGVPMERRPGAAPSDIRVRSRVMVFRPPHEARLRAPEVLAKRAADDLGDGHTFLRRPVLGLGLEVGVQAHRLDDLGGIAERWTTASPALADEGTGLEAALGLVGYPLDDLGVDRLPILGVPVDALPH